MLTRSNAKYVTLAAFTAALIPLAIAGCGGSDAERAVEDVAGVEEGTATRTADVDETTYTVEEVKRIRDAETGEVVGEEVSTTDVTVEQEVQIQREVEIKEGATNTETEGYVPDPLSDQ
ncbi:hypothetical protein [Tautonia rosea]|uniref:hypothetical protein n=1 Tax=Tautonia rosea TaxID=2728037 RepID=UPI0014735D28|nr:hypothetical protein [Tautonia rosea]